MAGPEIQPNGEKGVEAAQAAAEQLEKLQAVEKTAEKSVETQEKAKVEAKKEAVEQALSAEKKKAVEQEKKQPSAASRRHGVISKKEKEASFKKHISRVQNELPAGSRAFSKFIHNKGVEKTSEVLGSTVARPDAILSGAVAAFILVLGAYVVAKTFGYVLSGFETIGAFVIGWLLGIIYDYLKTIITGKSS